MGGLGGYADGDATVAEFDEPGGISYAEGILYVADTNNHVIRLIDLEEGLVDTLDFANPEALVIDAAAVTLLGGNLADNEVIELDLQLLAPGEGRIRLSLFLPENYTINPLINSQIEIRSDEGLIASGVVADAADGLPFDIGPGKGTLYADLTLYYCRKGAEALCFIEDLNWVIPYEASADYEQVEVALYRDITAPNL